MVEKKILLIEGNSDDEKLTLRALKKNQLVNPVVVARDGAEALELLVGDNSGTFNLVLLDLNLPKVSGVKILERIRGDIRTKLLPVLILTSCSVKPLQGEGFIGVSSGMPRTTERPSAYSRTERPGGGDGGSTFKIKQFLFRTLYPLPSPPPARRREH